MIAPHVVLTDGGPVLVDAAGQMHTPRALVRAVYLLTEQATYSTLWGDAAWARSFRAAADQRRVWLQWLEGTAGA